VFRPVLDPLLEGMHAGCKHLGKIPAGSKSRVKFEQSISQLQTELQAAIEQENYEEAARIRDQLKELEKKEQANMEG
jgi:protein arginine kinase activator